MQTRARDSAAFRGEYCSCSRGYASLDSPEDSGHERCHQMKGVTGMSAHTKCKYLWIGIVVPLALSCAVSPVFGQNQVMGQGIQRTGRQSKIPRNFLPSAPLGN